MNGTTISTITRKDHNDLVNNIEDAKKMITSEEVSPSTHAYSRGNYLIYDNNLYKVTAAISTGDTLSTSTNISLINVGEELKATSGGSAGGEVITPPTATTSNFTYSGSAQSIVLSGYDEDDMVISGNTATNANSYTAAVALMNGKNTWSDTKSNLPKLYPWQIVKAQPTLIVNTNSVELTTSTKYIDITVSYDGDAEWACSSNNIEIATATKLNSTTCRILGTWIGTTSITINAPETSNYLSSNVQIIDVVSKIYNIYGVSWDGSSDPSMTRTMLATNFSDPMPAIRNGTGFSPFDTLMPWSGMIKEQRTEGVVVKIPKFWYKLSVDEITHALDLQICDESVTGFSVSPAHLDRGDGAGERDYIYVGRYNCASDYKSKTGVKPITNIIIDTARSNIHNLGTNVWQYDYATHITIWMLYIVEFANWDSQTMIGYGCSTSGSSENTGSTDSMQYHTGTNATSRTAYGHVQYRYIEDLWANGYYYCDGINNTLWGSELNANLNPATFGDSSYNILVGTRPMNSGWITGFSVSSTSGFEWLLYPSTLGGSEGAYTCGYFARGSSGSIIYAGGSVTQGRYAGLFNLGNYYTISSPSTHNGCRLIELP